MWDEGQARRYYGSRAVRARLWEYLGGTEGGRPTCEYVIGYPPQEGAPCPVRPPAAYRELLAAGMDLARAAWDRRWLVCCLDLDYINFDFRGEAYVQPERVFSLLEPVRQAVAGVLAGYGVEHLALMTGKGYHFVWQAAHQDPLVARLACCGQVPETAAAKYRCDRIRSSRRVDPRSAAAQHGAGMLMEFICHQVLAQAPGELPLVCSGVTAAGGQRGREVVSLDLSGYADPLYRHNFRCAFSTHQKAQSERSWVGEGIALGTPVQICLPVGKLELGERLHLQRDQERAAELAAAATARIPGAGAGMSRALQAYLASGLRRCHEHFAAAAEEGWQEGDLAGLPPCAALPLAAPNDLLLQPTHLQTVWRVLAARGWHPRQVAGLVRSRYEQDHGWGWAWMECDAGLRAQAYLRLFHGLSAAGLDRPEEMTCEGHRRRGACPQPGCGHNLADYRPRGEAP